MKKCSSCKQEKDFSFFNIDKLTKSGFSQYCKECRKEKDRIRQKTRTNTGRKNWMIKFPERKKAHIKVYHAVKQGILKRQPCHVCGKNAEAHHPDYSRPLDVIWLCASHHRQAHNNC